MEKVASNVGGQGVGVDHNEDQRRRPQLEKLVAPQVVEGPLTSEVGE